MHIHSARRVEARKWVSQPLSIELVSKSSRSNVFVCRFASEAAAWRRCCLKTVRAEGPYLRHHIELLSRLAEGARSRAAVEEGDCLPHVLAYGIVGESPPRSDCGELLYSVSTWVEGVTLSRLIAQRARGRRPVPFSESLSLLLAVAVCLRDLLCFDPKAPLVHQDVKPSNIIISSAPCNRATLIDFDTAFFLDRPAGVVPCGSYGYAAPEGILRNEGWENDTMDVFSFGIVAHEVLTGLWPYPFPPSPRRDLSFWSARFRQGVGPRIDNGLPCEVRRTLQACVSLDPRERPNAFELVERMERLKDRYADSSASFTLANFVEPPPTPVVAPRLQPDLTADGITNGVAQ